MSHLRRSCRFLVLLGLFALPLGLRADDTIHTKADVNPVPVKTPPPEYPAKLRADGVTGVVALSVVIDEKGSVVDATVSKSTHPEFEAAALAAVKNWKFKPAEKAGAPVKFRVTVPIRFNVT